MSKNTESLFAGGFDDQFVTFSSPCRDNDDSNVHRGPTANPMHRATLPIRVRQVVGHRVNLHVVKLLRFRC